MKRYILKNFKARYFSMIDESKIRVSNNFGVIKIFSIHDFLVLLSIR